MVGPRPGLIARNVSLNFQVYVWYWSKGKYSGVLRSYLNAIFFCLFSLLNNNNCYGVLNYGNATWIMDMVVSTHMTRRTCIISHIHVHVLNVTVSLLLLFRVTWPL